MRCLSPRVLGVRCSPGGKGASGEKKVEDCLKCTTVLPAAILGVTPWLLCPAPPALTKPWQFLLPHVFAASCLLPGLPEYPPNSVSISSLHPPLKNPESFSLSLGNKPRPCMGPTKSPAKCGPCGLPASSPASGHTGIFLPFLTEPWLGSGHLIHVLLAYVIFRGPMLSL